MKKRGLERKDGSMTGPSDPERRRITKMIGALTLLGMGLGVNLDEVFADGRESMPVIDKVERPSSFMGKVEKPSVTQDKYSPAKPGSSFAKTSPAKPDASFAKTSPAKPGASFAKTSPAKPGVSIAKPVPANKPGVNLMKINTVEETGEQLLNIPATK